MTKHLDEKIDFLRDLDEVCERHLEKNTSKEMRSYITECQNNIQEELEPLEQENDYYADKYGPTPADIGE